jgi:hypothetical protein
MTETTEGVARYVTSGAFLRIDAPGGGRVRDFYGKGVPVPASAMTEKQTQHYLDHGLIERADAHGRPDHLRVDECLSAIICCIADEPGCEDWGRPRIAEAVRRAGFSFSNETLSRAIKRWKNPPAAPAQD